MANPIADRSKGDPPEPLDEERPTNPSQGEERTQDPETTTGEGHEERERRTRGQSDKTPGSRRLTTPMIVIFDEEEEKDPAWEVFCSPHLFILGGRYGSFLRNSCLIERGRSLSGHFFEAPICSTSWRKSLEDLDFFKYGFG
ncbi:hypothetical protein TIFTF001_041176 [Ficus carica]|uniref:Uncharacterized protein n=1 Tax=Ficus carica TaxID=3494 RepID=A0AA87ZK63_FICCA|nr:hypothetical protein TIFTF001_041176 [Ficus carica]